MPQLWLIWLRKDELLKIFRGIKKLRQPKSFQSAVTPSMFQITCANVSEILEHRKETLQDIDYKTTLKLLIR